MKSQETSFQAAYGEAMFYGHLLEDVLVLHLYECGYFKVNEYTGLSRKKIREMNHKKRIDELLVIYSDQDNADGSITRLVKALHHLRIIRNNIAHAFIGQVGTDVLRQEGRDQIIAMLKRISIFEKTYLRSLQKAHEAVIKGALEHSLELVVAREDPPFDARVSRSKIQNELDALEQEIKEG